MVIFFWNLAFVFAFVGLPQIYFSVIICFFGTSLLVSSWGFRTWLIPSRFTCSLPYLLVFLTKSSLLYLPNIRRLDTNDSL